MNGRSCAIAYDRYAAPYFDADRTFGGIRRQRHRHKLSALSIATLGAVARMAMGLPRRSASLTQRCNMAWLSPRANATATIDTPAAGRRLPLRH